MSTKSIIASRGMWNILAIVSLSAFVNIVTQVPDSKWVTSDYRATVAAIAGILAMGAAGVFFQLLSERTAAHLATSYNNAKEAAEEIQGTPYETSLRRQFFLSVGSLAMGICCTFASYRLG